MRTIVAGRHAATTAEFAELALGIDWALFDGEPGETGEEGAARVDAARDILADLWATDRDLARQVERMLVGLWAVDVGTAVYAELLVMGSAPAPVAAVKVREGAWAA
ncbi:hypothetical protein [Embleya sp. NBC_00896]|uniref:hypothetical protein n=1 Tax=Embleya sp. NBC_00896 TaxID=2975961 RepID=UPI0038653AF9|nr:hypothetical protein OG928_17680 [Embleya sp. NBC_00896]